MTSQEILHRKTKRVKFNSAIIIPSKLTNINEVFNDVRSDKYIMKVKRAMGRRNNDMSGVSNGNRIIAEKLAEMGRGRELVRVYLGYRVAVGGRPNTWPAVVQVGPDEPGISLSAEDGGELSGEVSSPTMVAEFWVGYREKLGEVY
ncbi:hypothetical protein Tco_0717886 [Tanacetum coccineum]